MISVDLARRLLSDGLLWQPEPGDRFTIDQPTLLNGEPVEVVTQIDVNFTLQ